MASKRKNGDAVLAETLTAEEQAHRDIEALREPMASESGNGSNVAVLPPPVFPDVYDTGSNGITKRAKAKRETFYLVIGTTKDGSCIDVLGRYDTGNQARKALEVMGMAVARAYGKTQVVQCRDRTSV